jgi:7-cyano-7-deazaguanine synthase
MCGIIGVLGTFPKKDILENLQNLSLRGRDGIGYWYSDGINSWVFRSASFSILSRDLNFNVLLGNSRAIPTTEIQQGAYQSLLNQQPFANKEWVVVHNGGISNDKELRMKYKIKTPSIVDSALLPDLFSKVGIVEGLKLIEGSYAICAYNLKDKTFWFGSNFMPLVYVKVNKGILVTSLIEMLPQRYRKQAIRVPPYTLYRKNKDGIEEFSLFREEPNKKVLVICSSGIDSTTAAYLYKHLGYNVSLLHFKYGQAAEKVEQWAVKKIAQHLKVPLIIYDAKSIFKHFKQALLLSQRQADPRLQIKDAESTLSYVPNRNMIFASIAGALAETLKIDTVALGAQQMDGIAYPDNNQPFIEAIDKSFKYSLNWYSNVRFRAPLLHLIKHEIVELGIKLGVPFEHVCSCYYPKLENGKIISCGKCGCCQFRMVSFKMIGQDDPATYEKQLTKKIKMVECGKVDVEKYVKPFC